MNKKNEYRPIANLSDEELHFEKIKNRKPVLAIVSAKEIYETDYPETEFLVQDLIPAVGLTLICGASKIGKSWFVLQLLHTISSAGEFLDRSISDSYCCLYLALEDTNCRIKNRFRKMKVVPNENLFIVTTCSPNDKGIAELQNTLEGMPRIKIVVIDTYGKFAAGRNESNFQNDYEWMSKLKKLAERNTVAVVLIHHTRKMKDESDTYNEILGTTAIMAVADSILLLSKYRHSKEGQLLCTSRDYEERKFAVEFDKSTCTWRMAGNGDIKPRASTPERQRILDALAEHGELSPQQLSGMIDSTAKNLSNILGLMRDEGLVENGSKRGFWRIVDGLQGELGLDG